VRDLPLTLRWYLCLLFLGAAVLVIGQVYLSPLRHPTHTLLTATALFVLLAYYGERTVVRIGQSLSLTLATTVHIATILLFPLPIPVLITLLATLLSSFHDTDYPLYKRAFNVAHEVCTVGVCSLVVTLVVGPSRVLHLDNVVALLPFLAFLPVLYYVLDSGLMIGVLSLLERRSPWVTWRDMYRRTLLPELATISIGILAATSWSVSPILLALFVLPVVALHITFKAIAQAEERATALGHVLRAAEHMQRLQQEPTTLLQEVATAALAISRASVSTAYLRDPDDPARLERVAVVPATTDGGPRHVPAPPSPSESVIGVVGQTITMPFAPDGPDVIGLVTLVGVHSDFGNAGRQALAILMTQAAGAWRNTLMHQRVEALASEDGLTGLLNHRSFHKRIEQEVARAGRTPSEPVALAMIDLDDFGLINNTYGHQAGDTTLAAVAAVLRENARHADLAARYGGDEFALILPRTEMDEALAVAERVRGALTGLRIIHEGAIIRVNASIGVAVLPLHADVSAALIRAADQAVYSAKNAGKGRVGRPEDSLLAQGYDIAALSAQLEHANLATVEALAAAVDAKDPYTRGHSRRVSDYAAAVAYALGCPPEDIARVRRAGLLHDVGKIGVPDAILLKPGGLTDEEYAVIKQHPEIGERVLRGLSFLQEILPAVRHHHERWDGHGYPDGLAGGAIPPDATILAVADSFDAMTSSRTYRSALSVAEAIRRVREGVGTQFDPRVAAAFAQALDTGLLQLPPLLQARDAP